MASEDDNPQTLAWRVRMLEQIERAQSQEIAELRERVSAHRDDVLKATHERYYTKAEAHNVFVTRDNLARAGERRLQLPIVIASVSMSIVAIANLAILIVRLG